MSYLYSCIYNYSKKLEKCQIDRQVVKYFRYSGAETGTPPHIPKI